MSKIITTEDLKSYMGKDLVAGHAQPLVDAVNAWIQTKTKRFWGETIQVTERYTYKSPLWLRHQDVLSVDLITLGFPGQPQTVLPATAYFSNELGRVTLLGRWLTASGASLPDYVAVTYTYGVEEIPDDLTHAALGIAAGYYNWAINGQKDIVSAGVGSYRLQYSGAVRGGSSGPDAATSTADALFAVVDSYSTRRV